MSSSESSPNKSGSFSVGLSTARFLDQAMLEESTPVVSAPAQPRPATPPSPPPAPAPAARSESDEDVNSYMQQLLKRTGVQPPAPAAPKAPPAPVWETKASAAAAAAAVAAASAPSDAASESDPSSTEGEPWSTENYIPKKQAPEREADLRAFRQLANASARGAVNNFQERKQRKQCTLSGLLAGGALIAAAPLLWLSSSWGDHWSLAAAGSIVLAIVSGVRFYKSRAVLPKKN